MSNARIQQVITLLYMHKIMVESDGIRKSEGEELKRIITRIDKNIDYYKSNQKIKGTLEFLKMVVDSWFQNE
jgi:hypothetical protein